MKKAIVLLLSVVMLAMCSSAFVSVADAAQTPHPITAATQGGAQTESTVNKDVASVITTAQTAAQQKTDDNALAARFLNMLNHNYVYNSDFENIDDMVNGCMPALLHLRDAQNDEFIDEDYVKGYIKDMYGIEIVDASALNSQWPQKAGYIYIIPRCFVQYEHSNISITENADGSYTVVTDVVANSDTASIENQKVVSLFVKNEESSFGYSMIYSNFIDNTADI